MVVALAIGALFGYVIGLLYREWIHSRTRFVVAGILGAWMGNYFWPNLGPSIYGFTPISTVLSAAVLIGLVWLLLSQIDEESVK